MARLGKISFISDESYGYMHSSTLEEWQWHGLAQKDYHELSC